MNEDQNAGEDCAFLQWDLAEDIATEGYSKILEAAVRTCTTT